ncbi:MAG: cofactor-independent phosphoglycerate mutase [Firmicutes bacterium]|nr:cofactor-independent phosphoglycerate mutase [Bacillota bacterium]
MKYIVVLGDGMADYPLTELEGKTPLQVAKKPHLDALTRQGVLGLVRTVPEGMQPGSDTANLSVLGYNPQECYTGRSPLEAASMGIKLQPEDITFRCNLVTLSTEDAYEERIMLDNSADEISTAEARSIIEDLDRHFGTEALRFYPGVAYRHLLVWRNGPQKWQTTPPHDILDQPVTKYLPQGPAAEKMVTLMKESAAFLDNHPVNQERRKKGRMPANSIWIWGEGQKPALPSFTDKYGLRGGVISAVDLIKGIGVCAGMEVIEVEGATGYLETNYAGKAKAALAALQKGLDFIYIHIEAPDECGHRQERDNKIKAIEFIDERIIGLLKQELAAAGLAYKMMVLPDHATPLALRTHTDDPVPFVIYDSTNPVKGAQSYDEQAAAQTGYLVEAGHTLMDIFLAPGRGEDDNN